ncbi:MAG: hypothetical protein IPL73_19765 [Candidatus Obscuribacter sp.]|nr:hypothetical protein [Candidatus Obscuribacter sp.]
MSNVVTLIPKSTRPMRHPQPGGDGSNVIAFRQINGVKKHLPVPQPLRLMNVLTPVIENIIPPPPLCLWNKRTPKTWCPV